MERANEHLREEVWRLVDLARESGELDHYPGKRSDVRVSENLQLEATTDLTRPAQTFAISMKDVSEGGCAFWCKRKLELKSRIYVRSFNSEENRPWLPAQVTHCTVGIRGYLIGAAFLID